MSDVELLALPKIRPEDAARYLQNGTTAQDTNIEAPLSTIEKAVENVLRRNSGMSDERIVVLLSQILEAILGIELDGEMISRAIDNYRRKEAVSRG